MAFSTSPNFSTAGGGKTLDSRLLDILKTAAASYGLDVQAFSGVAGRSTGTTNHPGGYAVDIKLVDPKTGQVLPDYQNAQSFPAYQKFAETARAVQQQKYPELGNTFRWGGYFSGGTNPMDLMHFDINPTMNGAMGGGSWANGPTAEFRKQWGLPDTGTAVAAIDQIAPTPMMRPASALGYVPQAPAPLGSMLGSGAASGPAPVSGVASLSAPPQTQNLFASGSPMSQSQVAELYKGILPTPPASLADAMQARFGNVTPSSSAASTYGDVAMNGGKPSWLPSVIPTPPRAPAPVDAMAQQILALNGMGPQGWAQGSGAQQSGSGAAGSSSLSPKPSWLPSTLPTPPQAKPSTPGMIAPGNIDLNNRPVYFGNDGTYGTERSFSIGTDKGEVLIPQIVNGQLVSQQEAIQHYMQTGENMGTFSSPAAADAYAQQTHLRDQGLGNMPVPMPGRPPALSGQPNNSPDLKLIGSPAWNAQEAKWAAAPPVPSAPFPRVNLAAAPQSAAPSPPSVGAGLSAAPTLNPAYLAWQKQYGTTATPPATTGGVLGGLGVGGGLVPPTAPVVPPMPNRYLPQAPTPMPRPTGPASSAGGNYTIRYGDTLNSIAAQTGIPVATLAAANGISDPNKIYAGQSLNLSGAPRAPSSGASVPTAPSPMSMPARSSGGGSSSGGSSSGSTISGSSTGTKYNVGQVYQTANGDKFQATAGGFVRI